MATRFRASEKTAPGPLPRVMAFASAVRLNDDELRELLHTRVIEVQGEKGEICVETLAQWANDLVAPAGDEGKLIEMWKVATSPVPHLLGSLLDDPARALRIHAVRHEVVQTELKAMADEAAIPQFRQGGSGPRRRREPFSRGLSQKYVTGEPRLPQFDRPYYGPEE